MTERANLAAPPALHPLERTRFITAKDDAGQWGVAMFHGGALLDRWTPEEAIALAFDLDAKAKLCFRQGQLPE